MRSCSTVVIALTLLTSGCATSGTQRVEGRCALLVGISSYERTDIAPRDRWADLHGPRNDVALLGEALVNAFGFHVTSLLDEAATAQGIRTAIDQHLLQCVRGPGDVALLHFSGHGQQIPDDNGDEPDGYDEALVPYDHRGQSEPDAYIRDDEVEEWVRALSKKTDHVVVSFDSCHSGTAMRAADDEVVTRGAPPRLPPATRSASDAPSSGLFEQGSTEQPALIYLAAAKSHEKAHERLDPDCEPVGHPKCYNGRFSYWLAQELGLATERTSYRELARRIDRRFAMDGGGQSTELLGGSHDRLLFSTRPEPASIKTFLATPLDYEAEVEVNAGQAHGVQAGDRFDLHPIRGSLPPGERPLAVVEAVTVHETKTYAKVVDRSDYQPLESTRAVLSFERRGESPLTLYLDDTPPELAQKLRYSDHFQPGRDAPPPQAQRDSRQIFLSPRPDGKLELRDGTERLLPFPTGRERSPLMALSPADPLAAERVRTALESHVRRARIVELAQGKGPSDARLELLLDRSGTQGAAPPIPTNEHLEPITPCAKGSAECAKLVIKVANQTSSDLHITALHINPDGRITVYSEPEWVSRAGMKARDLTRYDIEAPLTPGEHQILLIATTEATTFEPLGYDLDDRGLGQLPATGEVIFPRGATRSAGAAPSSKPKWHAQSWSFRVGNKE